jgi:hypothetical protein
MSLDPSPSAAEPTRPAWQPLSAVDRRVVGVLVEKAKTTPAGYPMTLNAICTGCNQKSNRDPEMQLEPDDVQESLDRLRGLAAVTEVQGDGRVPKYRHHMYQWLGVEKVEMAVMTELLLRGAQTIGELRGRAARMEPIADAGALRPILASLVAKGLIVALTPEGRGQIVTHALYTPRELERIRVDLRAVRPAAADEREPPGGDRAASSSVSLSAVSSSVSARPKSWAPSSASLPIEAPNFATSNEVVQLRREVEDLREEVQSLRKDLDELRAMLL